MAKAQQPRHFGKTKHKPVSVLTPAAGALATSSLCHLGEVIRHPFFQRSGIRDQTGVLETLPDESNIAAACFKGMGSFRLTSQTGEPYTTRPAAPFNV